MITYLSLGSNLGNKQQNLLLAVQLIQEQVGQVLKQSSFYYSKPWGFQSPNDFVNICIAVQTTLSPLHLLQTTQYIEQLLGRHSKTSTAYADRIIDIDILLYDDVEMHTPQLTIPHPLMQKRDFVMIPLREIISPEHYTLLCNNKVQKS